MAARDLDDGAWRSLQTQLIELERDRSEARERLEMLARLYAAFADIAVTNGPQEILDHTLRAAHDPLGFSRAIFFSIEPPIGITARRVLDGGDTVEGDGGPTDAAPGNALLTAAYGESGYDVGFSSDLSAPLVDCRGWYVIARLEHAGRVVGLLYVDGHRNETPREPETSLVSTLAAVAAVAVDNSRLFAQTLLLAERDPLTGLFNRRAFSARASAEIERCQRERNAVAYAVVDIDDFKAINDSKGHAFGDMVLTRVARTLSRNSRPQDVVGRFAGDEFVLLFTDVDAAQAHTLVARLSSELKIDEVSCSIGAALYPKDGCNAQALFLAADGALYATKARGKNGFTFA